MDLPEVFVSDEPSEDAAADEFARRLADLGIDRPLVVASSHGDPLMTGIASAYEPVRPPEGGNQTWAGQIGTMAQDRNADAIVAVGGGRCLDLGKLAAARAGLTVVVAPTHLSHDGICSPVAVVPNEEGRSESLGAIAPKAVFLSIATITKAPEQSMAAGIGDLLANPLALRDWQLAVDHGLEELDQRAWEMSAESYDLVESDLKRGIHNLAADPDFVRRLADALVLSGTSMIASGTSRPASGGEHEISHAIDFLYNGRALHGAQVALGCIVSMALYGDDVTTFRELLRRLELPDTPDALGLDKDDMVRILLQAPETRPGRFTVLEEAALDEAAARNLVEKIWS